MAMSQIGFAFLKSKFDPKKNNIQQAIKLEVSVDLIKAAQYELQLLRTVNKHPLLYGGKVLKRAIQRYEQLWLPLAAKHKNQDIMPPLDIQWVWYVHMLAPEYYEADCKAIVGVIIDHKLIDESSVAKKRSTAKKLWQEMYKQPFEVNITSGQTAQLNDYPSKITYGLESAIQRQSLFFYQVSLPHYTLKSFLRPAINRYKQLLLLKAQNPKEFLVPCYDMDVIWHAHMAHPVAYLEDTKRILGQVFKHDDSVNDRSPGSKLNTSDALTRKLWKESYGEEFGRDGSMFRGVPPENWILPMSEVTRNLMYEREYKVKIKKFKISGMPMGEFKIKIQEETVGRSHTNLVKISLKKENAEQDEIDVADQDATFTITDSGIKTSYVIVLSRKYKFMQCCSPRKQAPFNYRCAFNFKMLLALEDKSNEVKKTFFDGTAVKIELFMDIKVRKLPHFSNLSFLTGRFKNHLVDKSDLSKYYGIVTSGSTDEPDIELSMATHRIVNSYKLMSPTVFEVEVFHKKELLLSAIHLYTHTDGFRKLVGVAHTIDNTQLITDKDITGFMDGGCGMSLNPKKGERAMIIKTVRGDFYILLAKWTAMREGQKAGASGRGRPGYPGHLNVKWLNVSNWSTESQDFPLNDNWLKWRCTNLSKCSIELKSGDIKLDPHLTTVPSLLFTLSLALLHVLCHPREKDKTSEKKKRLNVQEMDTLSAFGYYESATPHNNYIAMDLGIFMDGCGGCGSCGG